MEKTLALIKPDAVAAGRDRDIIQLIELNGFVIIAKKCVRLTAARAQDFYSEHTGKPFFPRLLDFMTSGPVWALLLAKHDAIASWRAMMGPTNSDTARAEAPQSLRAVFGSDGTRNATHGSDSPASAAREIKFFFPDVAVELPPAEEASSTFDNVLQDSIKQGLVALGQERPSTNPTTAVKWLADWLLEHNPNRPRIVAPGDSVVFGDEDDEADFAPYMERQRAQEAARSAAATTVQSNFRGFKDRKQVKQKRSAHDESRRLQATLAMIKPDAVAAGAADAIVAEIEAAGFAVLRKREYQLTEAQAEGFYAEHVGKPFFPALKQFMTSGPIVALALLKPGAIAGWRALMGPTNTAKAKADAPGSLRARFGTDGTRNAMHGSDSIKSAERELAFHFPEGVGTEERTLAMIKPDAVAAGAADRIVEEIEANGFEVVRQRQATLMDAEAEDFYAEHKGKPFFPTLKAFMTSGPMRALELRRESAIAAWRALMGPTNSEKAKAVSPLSLRARFGTDGTRNATHGSDSPASAAREIDFHFPSPLERTLAVIKPDAVAADRVWEILDRIAGAGFRVVGKREYCMSAAEVDAFYADQVGEPGYAALREFMTSGPIVALELEKEGAIAAWQEAIGPASAEQANSEAPNSLRAFFGTDGLRDAVHGSSSAEAAARELALHFPDAHPPLDAESAQARAAAAGERPMTEATRIAHQVTEDTVAAVEESFLRPGSKSCSMSMSMSMDAGGPDRGKPKTTAASEGHAADLSGEPAPSPGQEQPRELSPDSRTAASVTKAAFESVQASLDANQGEMPDAPDAADAGASAGPAESEDTGAVQAQDAVSDLAPRVETTLAVIKPDAVAAGKVEEILARIADAGFEVVAQREYTLSEEQAAAFYGEHEGKEFFPKLMEFMTSGPIVALALRKEGAIGAWRELMGPTNATQAKETAAESLRAAFGTDGTRNAVHGSDSAASAARELAFHFAVDFPIAPTGQEAGAAEPAPAQSTALAEEGIPEGTAPALIHPASVATEGDAIEGAEQDADASPAPVSTDGAQGAKSTATEGARTAEDTANMPKLAAPAAEPAALVAAVLEQAVQGAAAIAEPRHTQDGAAGDASAPFAETGAPQQQGEAHKDAGADGAGGAQASGASGGEVSRSPRASQDDMSDDTNDGDSPVGAKQTRKRLKMKLEVETVDERGSVIDSRPTAMEVLVDQLTAGSGGVSAEVSATFVPPPRDESAGQGRVEGGEGADVGGGAEQKVTEAAEEAPAAAPEGSTAEAA